MQKIILITFIIFFSLFKYVCADDEYRTLKNDKANLRQGPSFEYPVKIFYKKKFLPVLILDSSDNFKKIRDHENNSGWIHVSQLSKKKAAIVIDDDVIVFSKPSVFSTPLVILRKGRLCKIVKCKQEWCRIKVDKYKGWIKKDGLWGLL